jgi:hypothetical protein
MKSINELKAEAYSNEIEKLKQSLSHINAKIAEESKPKPE